MARALVALAMLWPAVAAAAVLSVASGHAPAWTAGVYGVGSRICHQQPERSFHVSGVGWPVCARCSGLYLGAAAAAWVGTTSRARARVRATRLRLLLAASAAPTIATWAAERLAGVPFTNGFRFAAALPLGAVLAAAIVAVAAESRGSDQVN